MHLRIMKRNAQSINQLDKVEREVCLAQVKSVLARAPMISAMIIVMMMIRFMRQVLEV